MFSITSIMRRLRRRPAPSRDWAEIARHYAERHASTATVASEASRIWAMYDGDLRVPLPTISRDTTAHWRFDPRPDDLRLASALVLPGDLLWFGPDWDDRQASWQYRAIDWSSWPGWFEALPRALPQPPVITRRLWDDQALGRLRSRPTTGGGEA